MNGPQILMGGARKYLHVGRITWKSMLAYTGDTWLSAGLTGFRVLLAFLLWSAVFTGREEVGGFTLPMMITYSLVASLLANLQHHDGLAWQLANEVREGQFSKYLVAPVSVAGYFLGAGLGRWAFLLLFNLAALLVWLVAFSRWLVIGSGADLLWLLVLLPLGALCMLLLNHSLALLSLRFQDIGGMMILKGSVIDFLSGTLVPLSLLPVGLTAVLKLTPFYYVVYYPATLVLGRQTEPPALAAVVLVGWCLVLWLGSEIWFRRARRFYEGVGI
jgi:ABC-2 type transport system permease protein